MEVTHIQSFTPFSLIIHFNHSHIIHSNHSHIIHSNHSHINNTLSLTTNVYPTNICYCLHQERSSFSPIFVFFKNLYILSGFKLRIP